jgi:hypothetical protein
MLKFSLSKHHHHHHQGIALVYSLKNNQNSPLMSRNYVNYSYDMNGQDNSNIHDNECNYKNNGDDIRHWLFIVQHVGDVLGLADMKVRTDDV